MFTRKTWTVISVAVLAALLLGIIYVAQGSWSVTLSEETLRNKISEKIPFKREFGRSFVLIDRLDFNLDNDLINLKFDVRFHGFAKEIKITATTTGALVYNDRKGSFHFRPQNIKFSETSLAGFKTSKTTGEVALTATEWSLGWYLNNFPVYKIPNDLKGTVAKMSLKSVEIKNGEITAHLSFWQLTKTVLLYTILFIVFLPIGFGFVMNAHWTHFLILGIGD